MSIEIFYDKQFIKLSDGRIFPFVLSGSSNCFDVDGRRDRSWTIFTGMFGSDLAYTPEKIMQVVDDYIDKVVKRAVESKYGDTTEEKARENFFWHAGAQMSGKSSAKQFRNIYKYGIKRALSIEELSFMGLHFGTDTYYRKYDIDPPEQKDITTEKEFFDEWGKWKEWKNQATVLERDNEEPYFFITMSNANHRDEVAYKRLIDSRKKFHSKKEKKEVTFDKYFVLKKGYKYFVRKLKWGYKYSPYRSVAKKFTSESQVHRYLKKYPVLIDKHEFEIETVTDNPITKQISV